MYPLTLPVSMRWRIWDSGGGGVVDTKKHECNKLAQYVEGYEEPLVQIVKAAEERQVH